MVTRQSQRGNLGPPEPIISNKWFLYVIHAVRELGTIPWAQFVFVQERKLVQSDKLHMA